MGREIRRVPADWEHPRYTKDAAPRESMVGQLIALYDKDLETAAANWMAELDLWRAGKHPDQPSSCKYFWQWNGGPPDADRYRERKWTEAEATHFQMYETVTEGTPVTPVFATREALIEHLVAHGDAWDEKRGHGGWSRTSAESFVNAGWAPSMIMTAGKIYEPKEMGEMPK